MTCILMVKSCEKARGRKRPAYYFFADRQVSEYSGEKIVSSKPASKFTLISGRILIADSSEDKEVSDRFIRHIRRQAREGIESFVKNWPDEKYAARFHKRYPSTFGLTIAVLNEKIDVWSYSSDYPHLTSLTDREFYHDGCGGYGAFIYITNRRLPSEDEGIIEQGLKAVFEAIKCHQCCGCGIDAFKVSHKGIAKLDLNPFERRLGLNYKKYTVTP